MRYNPRILWRYLPLVIFLNGCYKDGPPGDVKPVLQTNMGTKGVFITNEGNFQFGNASVSYLDLTSGVVTEDLYKQSNGTSLGDVCQSMFIFNGKAYLIVNNSGKVEICNSLNLKSEAIIEGLRSPRYFLPISNNKAYITDLYDNAVAVADLVHHKILKKILVKGETGPMVLLYGNAFVTSANSKYLYILNTSGDVLQDSILISKGANSIKQDNNGKLWVTCSNDAKNKIPGAIYRIDPQSKHVELKLDFQKFDDSPWRLCTNITNDTLYFLNKEIYQMSVNANALPSTPFILSDNRNYYGLGVDPLTGTLYVADALDYVQRGRVYRFSSKGDQIDYFLTGIIPGDFWFQ